MTDPVRRLIGELRQLRRQGNGAGDAAFWRRFAGQARQLCLAEQAAIVQPGQAAPELLALEPPTMEATEWLRQPWLEGLMSRASRNDFAASPPGSDGSRQARVAVRLLAEQPLFLVLLVGEEAMPRLNDVLLRAQLVADIGASGGSVETGHGALRFLDLIAETYGLPRFSTAAYALVNGLVSHATEIDQAVLGWREGAYVRVKAISHFDRFEKKTELVKVLEAAMEEAADQALSIHDADAEQHAGGMVVLAHRQLRQQLQCRAVFSLCLGDDAGNDQAVVLLVSHQEGLPQGLRESVHFVGQVTYPRLRELKQREDGLPRRALRALRRSLAWVVGPENVWSKTFAVLLSALLAYALLGTLTHRVEGSAQLTTDSIRLVSAPFDGRIDQAAVSAGDEVAADAILAVMDREDLLLQRAELQADLQRNLAEVNRARAAFDLIESEVASARVAQNRARLQRLAVYLDEGEVRAPFAGVVVEGERQDLLGLPVARGDALYRIARIEGMYLRIEIPQESVHFIEAGDRGDFVFVSQPDRKLPFTVRRIIPMAQVRDAGGAVFEVKADLDVTAEDWWRPGMGGVAKVDKGPRPLLWVIGHRLVNRLRLWLWW